MKISKLVCYGAVALAASVVVGAFACQSTSATGAAGSPAEGNGLTDGKYAPKGCSFSIAGRDEYKSLAADGPARGTGNAGIRRVRLGLGGNVTPGAGYADAATSVAIAWQTDDGDFGTEVRWGTTAEAGSWKAEDVATGITWLTPQGQLGPNGDQRMHESYLCGLTPGTKYYYQVRGGAEQSDVYSFTTAPADGTTPVRLAVTGDSRGQHANAWQILEHRLLGLGLTAQLFSGDMVNLAPSQVEWEQWVDKAWKDETGKPSALGQLLMLPTHGNHENHTPLYFGNVVLPQSPEVYPEYLEYFYSTNLGAVHLVVVDDFSVVSPGTDQNYASVVKKWLQDDLALANQNRSKQPWVVVMHHHPSYSSSDHGKDADVLRGRAFFAPIWDEGKVDMVFSGHDHDYERSLPLTAGADPNSPKVMSPGQGGTVYLVCAGSGADGYGESSSYFTGYSGTFGGETHLGVYGVLEASMTELCWQPYWIDDAGDTAAEPQTTLTK